jgi:ubiquinone/menaquinone biosynthesis C-methylase UbiE
MSEVNSVNLTAAATAFDRVAHSYDDVFTRSVIGRAQRNQVWQRLLAAFSPGERILELNCGTGEDARFLAQKGRSVVACDASSVMIEVAKGRGKLEAGSGSAGTEYRQLANEDLSALLGQETFDGAFSNFSGLNCVADLQPVARNLARLVKPGGRVLICVWSRVCVAELAWFLLRGQVGKASRRLSGKAAARVGGVTIEVSYPTVRTVRRVFSPWFRLESHRAVGLFVPPSYVESWARKHDQLFARLEKLDQVFSSLPMFRVAGDHMLLEFVRCDS